MTDPERPDAGAAVPTRIALTLVNGEWVRGDCPGDEKCKFHYWDGISAINSQYHDERGNMVRTMTGIVAPHVHLCQAHAAAPEPLGHVLVDTVAPELGRGWCLFCNRPPNINPGPCTGPHKHRWMVYRHDLEDGNLYTCNHPGCLFVAVTTDAAESYDAALARVRPDGLLPTLLNDETLEAFDAALRAALAAQRQPTAQAPSASGQGAVPSEGVSREGIAVVHQAHGPENRQPSEGTDTPTSYGVAESDEFDGYWVHGYDSEYPEDGVMNIAFVNGYFAKQSAEEIARLLSEHPHTVNWWAKHPAATAPSDGAEGAG